MPLFETTALASLILLGSLASAAVHPGPSEPISTNPVHIGPVGCGSRAFVVEPPPWIETHPVAAA